MYARNGFSKCTNGSITQHLVQQKRLLDKSASFPEGDTTESSRLRQVLLQHKNQLDQTNETIEKLQSEIVT